MKPMTVKDFKESCKKDWDNAAWKESLINALQISGNLFVAIKEAEELIKQNYCEAKEMHGMEKMFNIFKKAVEK